MLFASTWKDPLVMSWPLAFLTTMVALARGMSSLKATVTRLGSSMEALLGNGSKSIAELSA